jgi:hypothetical protein
LGFLGVLFTAKNTRLPRLIEMILQRFIIC